jgi:ribosomal-protein-alanine N-acetyltransferase
MSNQEIRPADVTTGYFLKTQRLGFRHWSEADAAHAQSLWGDADVTRLFGGPFSAAEVGARLVREIEQQAAHGVQYWPIFLQEDDTFVGCCGLRPYPQAEGVLEIGFHLRPHYWRSGLASEAARATIGYAFDELKVAGLFAGHHPQNAASARLLEKLGFRYVRHEFYPPTGLEHLSYMLQASVHDD